MCVPTSTGLRSGERLQTSLMPFTSSVTSVNVPRNTTSETMPSSEYCIMSRNFGLSSRKVSTYSGRTTTLLPLSISSKPLNPLKLSHTTESPMNVAANAVSGSLYTSNAVPVCSTFPSLRSTMRSAMSTASSWSWVTKTAVTPTSRIIERSQVLSSFLTLESMAANGSSRRRMAGSVASALANATLWRCPPES